MFEQLWGRGAQRWFGGLGGPFGPADAEAFGLGGLGVPGGFPRGGRGRSRGQGRLRYLILHLLAEQPRHGYELIRSIEELSGGAYVPSPGAVYPTLTMLEEMGLAQMSGTDGSRKVYTITDEGRAFLEAHHGDVEAAIARMKAAAGANVGPQPDVQRAALNVGRAVFIRPGRERWTAEQAEHVVAILDRAAAEIEQI